MSDNSGDPKDDKNKKGGPLFPFGGPNFPDLKPFGGWKFLAVYVVVLLVGMSVFNHVLHSRLNPTIDFSEFRARISSGEIRRVELSDTYFTGFTTETRPDTPRSPLARTPHPSTAQGRVFRTVAIFDPNFITFMDEHGVAYGAVSRQRNAILNFVFSWVLPIAFFIFIWRFLLKRLGNMGGNVLSVGQNRAVIVAEGDIVTRFKDVAGVDEAKEELVEVVDFLKSHPQVEKVNHPSLSDHRDHAMYKKYFPKGAGSIFAFDLAGGKDKAQDFTEKCKLFSFLANVADVKSLIIHPASTTHSQLGEDALLKSGIKPNTIRLSIGTEHIDDIIADLSQAFNAVAVK